MLEEVVKAVQDRCDVYMDGGVRRGTDVLKALALGAKAVFIGRPVLWGLCCQVKFYLVKFICSKTSTHTVEHEYFKSRNKSMQGQITYSYHSCLIRECKQFSFHKRKPLRNFTFQLFCCVNKIRYDKMIAEYLPHLSHCPNLSKWKPVNAICNV